VPNVVFTCGAVELGDRFFGYYGGADSVIGVATVFPYPSAQSRENIEQKMTTLGAVRRGKKR